MFKTMHQEELRVWVLSDLAKVFWGLLEGHMTYFKRWEATVQPTAGDALFMYFYCYHAQYGRFRFELPMLLSLPVINAVIGVRMRLPLTRALRFNVQPTLGSSMYPNPELGICDGKTFV